MIRVALTVPILVPRRRQRPTSRTTPASEQAFFTSVGKRGNPPDDPVGARASAVAGVAPSALIEAHDQRQVSGSSEGAIGQASYEGKRAGAAVRHMKLARGRERASGPSRDARRRRVR